MTDLCPPTDLQALGLSANRSDPQPDPAGQQSNQGQLQALSTHLHDVFLSCKIRSSTVGYLSSIENKFLMVLNTSLLFGVPPKLQFPWNPSQRSQLTGGALHY